MKIKIAILTVCASLTSVFGQFAPQQEGARYAQIYNSIASMVSTRPDRLPTTNAICNVGVTAGDQLAGAFYWDSSNVSSTNNDTLKSTFPGLETTGRWVRISVPGLTSGGYLSSIKVIPDGSLFYSIIETNSTSGNYSYLGTNGGFHATNITSGSLITITNGGAYFSSNLVIGGTSPVRFPNLPGGGPGEFLAIAADGSVGAAQPAGGILNTMVSGGSWHVGDIGIATDTSGTNFAPARVTLDGSGGAQLGALNVTNALTAGTINAGNFNIGTLSVTNPVTGLSWNFQSNTMSGSLSNQQFSGSAATIGNLGWGFTGTTNGMFNNAGLAVVVDGVQRWTLGSASISPFLDNTYAIGNSSFRPSTIYAGSHYLGSSGSAGSPLYSFTSSSIAGMWYTGAATRVDVDSTHGISITTSAVSPATDAVMALGSSSLHYTGLFIDSTVTTPGTTGNQTINKNMGRVNIAAGGTTITVTDSKVTTASFISAIAASNDTTAQVKNVVPGSGTFTINMVSAVTLETPVSFYIVN